jgi:hypothetical protein
MLMWMRRASCRVVRLIGAAEATGAGGNGIGSGLTGRSSSTSPLVGLGFRLLDISSMSKLTLNILKLQHKVNQIIF